MTRRTIGPIAVVAAIALGLAACGGTDAEDARAGVCRAAAELEDSVDAVIDAAADLDFDTAQQALDAAAADAADLGEAARDLADRTREEVEPQIDDLVRTVNRLADTDNLRDALDLLEQAVGQLGDVVSVIGDNLEC